MSSSTIVRSIWLDQDDALDRIGDKLRSGRAKRGLSKKRFLAKRGEVLMWRSGLRHGGAAVSDESKTRKSFVVHYSTLRSHPARSITIEDQGRMEVGTTRELIDARGFANPLHGQMGYVR